MSVRKDEKRGRYIAVVECGDLNGKRVRKQKSFQTKKDALRWEREMQGAAENLNMSKYDISFEELGKAFIQYKTMRGLAEGTVAKHRNAIRKVLNFTEFQKKAREIKMADIESVLVSLGKIYSKTYLQDIKGTISAVMSYGVDQDYLIKNPCSHAAMPIDTKPGRDNIDSFTKEEVDIIESHRNDIEFGDIVFLMLRTGLRMQEVCAIDTESLITKREKPYLRVNKALRKNERGKWFIDKPKTENSIRDIPINEEIKAMILKRIIANPYHVLLPGITKDKYISSDGFRRKYKNFFAKLNKIEDNKVRNLPPHCCRHTFTSRCEWSNVPVAVTKELLGHTAITMTYKYTHAMDDDKERAIAALN